MAFAKNGFNSLPANVVAMRRESYEKRPERYVAFCASLIPRRGREALWQVAHETDSKLSPLLRYQSLASALRRRRVRVPFELARAPRDHQP